MIEKNLEQKRLGKMLGEATPLASAARYHRWQIRQPAVLSKLLSSEKRAAPPAECHDRKIKTEVIPSNKKGTHQDLSAWFVPQMQTAKLNSFSKKGAYLYSVSRLIQRINKLYYLSGISVTYLVYLVVYLVVYLTLIKQSQTYKIFNI